MEVLYTLAVMGYIVLLFTIVIGLTSAVICVGDLWLADKDRKTRRQARRERMAA